MRITSNHRVTHRVSQVVTQRASHRVTHALVAVVLVVGVAACDDDADGRFDMDRYQEQDRGAGPATDSDPTTSGAGDVEVADPVDGADPDDAAASEPVDGTASDGTASDEAASGVLDDEEVAGLLWMREEEQLAHDVYTLLGEQWGLRVFENIAASEQNHIDATVDLLDRYGIDDPAAGNESGTFTDPAIQQLFDDLIARGTQSAHAALAVGATIEELDIADLRVRAEATDEAAIDAVYARLERGSRNHLRAFVGQLELLGVDYEPTLLDDFDEIVSTPIERGPGH